MHVQAINISSAFSSFYTALGHETPSYFWRKTWQMQYLVYNKNTFEEIAEQPQVSVWKCANFWRSIHLNDSNYSMFSMKKWSLIFNICLHIMFQTGKRFEIFRGKVRTERAQRRRSVTAFHHEYWIKFCLANFGGFVIWYKNVAAYYTQTCHVSN